MDEVGMYYSTETSVLDSESQQATEATKESVAGCRSRGRREG